MRLFPNSLFQCKTAWNSKNADQSQNTRRKLANQFTEIRWISNASVLKCDSDNFECMKYVCHM